MLDKSFPSIFQRIQVQIVLDGKKRRYYTRIEDFDEQTLMVGMPLEKEARDAIQAGSAIDAIAIAESCLYLFPATVQRIEQMGDFPVLVLDRPAQPKRLQRRNFFRVSVRLAVKFRMLDKLSEISSEAFQRAETRDLSGGGVLLMIDKSVRTKEYVEMEMSTPGAPVHAVGRVARTVPSMRRKDKVEIGVEFMRINKADQERIIRFVFEKQRRERADHPGD